MVSRCCSTDVYIEGCTPMYYVCDHCGLACDLREIKDADMGSDHQHGEQRNHRAIKSTRGLASMPI